MASHGGKGRDLFYSLVDGYKCISMGQRHLGICRNIQGREKEKAARMRIFFDTEFTGLHQFTTLISIGLVAEDGKEFYAEFTDYDKTQVDNWLKENVVDKLHLALQDYRGLSIGPRPFRIRENKISITEYLDRWLRSFEQPLEMWSDTLAWDWVLFCQLWEGAFGLPKCVYYIPFDIATLFKAKGLNPDINRETFALINDTNMAKLDEDWIREKKHNALWDAKVIKACYEKLVRM